jgi:hypothetical protein
VGQVLGKQGVAADSLKKDLSGHGPPSG